MRDPRREPPRDISRDASDDSYVDYQPLEGPPSDENAAPQGPETESRTDNREPDRDRPAAIDEPLFPDEPAASRGGDRTGASASDRGYDDYDDYDDELDGDRYDRP